MLLSQLLAENSISSLAMYEEGFIIILLLIIILICYFLFEWKYFLKLWDKYNSLTFESNKRIQVIPNISTRISLLEFKQWQYRGEGNEYLAISLPDQRKILRLRKSLCPTGFIPIIQDWYNQQFSTNIAKETKAAYFEKLNLEYYKILTHLIGECYVQPSEEILLIQSEINKVNNIISSQRPVHRKKKRIAYACGSLLTDYAYLPSEWDMQQFVGPTFAVEIKPKQGWIPETERIYRLCTYCLNQYLKLQNNETSTMSHYCPMDLFSGQTSRMKNAIKCLLKTPQNNLKIFQNGILVHGENKDTDLETVFENLFENKSMEKSINDFCDLITKALLKQLHNSNNHECTNSVHLSYNFTEYSKRNNFYQNVKECKLNNDELPQGCVLDRILNLQKLDLWGSEKMSLYLKEQSELCEETNYNHVSSLVTRAKNLANYQCAKCFFAEIEDVKNVHNIVQKYLMSAIAKDCSLMLTFRKLKQYSVVKIPDENVIKTVEGLYAFQIGVFDLYPKPMSCILKHVRKRHKFAEIYKHVVMNK